MDFQRCASALCVGGHDDFADHGAELRSEFVVVGAAGGEAGFDGLDVAAIGLTDAGQDLDRVGDCRVGDLPLDRVELLMRVNHVGLRRRIIAQAVADRVEQTSDARFQPIALALELGHPIAAGALHCCRSTLPFIDEVLDKLGGEQMLLHRAENARLEQPGRYRPVVAASACLPPRRAAPAIGTDDSDRAPTYTALHDAGEQPLGPSLAVDGEIGRALDARLHSGPRGGIDDAERLGFPCHPLTGLVEARDALAALGILVEALAVEDDNAGVELVMDDAIAASATARDGVGAPQTAARGSNPLPVEIGGDRTGAAPPKIFVEDPANDSGLIIVDDKPAPFDIAAPIDARLGSVAIGLAAGDPAGMDIADLAAPGLVA